MGGSFSKGKSQSTTAPGSVWGAQSPYLESLYQKAFETMGGRVNTQTSPGQWTGSGGGSGAGGYSDLYGMGMPGGGGGGLTYTPGQTTTSYDMGPTPTASGPAFDYAQQIAGGAQNAFGNQAGGGFVDPRLQQNLQAMGSGQYQNRALGGAIQAGLGDIGRNFQRNIMPSINTGSALTNTSGGSRQGIAQGLAASDANQQASDFVNRMYSQNFGQQLQSMLGANQQLGGLQGQRNIAQQSAMGQAPQLAGLGGAPEQAYWQQQFAPLGAFQSILGAPTILGGGSQATSKNTGISGGIGFGV